MNISYECQNLIDELKQDIIDFGEDNQFYAMYENFDGVEFVTNYDFINDIELDKDETKNYSKIETMSAKDLLNILEEQNKMTIE